MLILAPICRERGRDRWRKGGLAVAAAFAEPEDFPLFCVRSANRTAKCRLVRYLNHKEQKNIKTDYHA